LLVTEICVLLKVAISLWSIGARVPLYERWNGLKATPVADLVFVPFLLCGVLIGMPMFWFVYRLRATRGFMLFSTLTCIGLIALVAALSLDTTSLSTTELQHLSVDQILQIALLLVASVAPVSAFLGWYCAAQDTGG